MSENNFLLPAEEYQRAISPVKDWIKQTALYASKMTGKPLDACVKHLEAKLKAKAIPFNNPQVIHFERAENGDREKTTSSLATYIRNVISNNEVLAPTFTSYLHPDIKRSVIVDFLDLNVAQRKKYKKTSQKHESEGNVVLYKYYDQLQDSAKRQNNSVSGGFVAEGSVINNKSAHSTLTSTTRSISSLSNASNERLIEGNRHYFTPQIALNNLISIVVEMDFVAIDLALRQFGLHAPTSEETIDCVKRSTDLYWHDSKQIEVMRSFVEKLSPVERAAIVYTGDLYHLRIYNDAFLRGFITDFARRGSTTPVEDPIAKIWKIDEQIVNYAHQINITMLAGKGKDYDKLTQDEQFILVNTCNNIVQTIEKYKVFLKAFFLTKNSPCTIATIPSMIRRSVVLSDTDSTMFACDNWVEWYFGKLEFTDDGFAVAGAIMFMATQSISHILALFSANMNVERKRLHTLAMKPEYVFPVFAQTSVAKHYYTAMLVKEGNVYKDIKMEIKGVHMKDSTVPTNIITGAAKEMEAIIRQVMRGELVSLEEKVQATATLERSILESLYKGETTYLRRFKIKEAAAYKLGAENSPYQYYSLWEQAFSSTYGKAPLPPYNAVRIPLDLPNRTAVKEWFEKIPNREVAEGIIKWFTDNQKQTLTSFPIPTDHCASNGVPEELKMVMDSRKIVLTLTKSYRNMLESLGYFSKKDFLVCEQIMAPTPLPK